MHAYTMCHLRTVFTPYCLWSLFSLQCLFFERRLLKITWLQYPTLRSIYAQSSTSVSSPDITVSPQVTSLSMGNKHPGTYPNGVPFDKRRYNPQHPKYLRPPSNSPAFSYPADVWMTRAPYTTTWEFQLANFVQKRGPARDRIGMDGLHGLNSRADGNAGDVEGIDAMDGEGVGSGQGAAGLRRASATDPIAAAGSGQIGTGEFRARRGGKGPSVR